MSKEAKRFPEIQVYPQPPSAYKIIEPYVDFVADLEAEKVRSEVMHGELAYRSQTTPSKTRKQNPHVNVNGNVNAPTPTRPNTTKSPRNIKTAPASTESQMVRDSLISAKKHSQPNVQVDTMKTPFEKAVESLAAMKLHDYAVKRKERLRNRYKLWDEIRGTQREMEISGAEQAIIEFSEQLAAWKIKYYVELYRKKVVFEQRDEEKKNLIKQLKLQKKKIQTLQKDLLKIGELEEKISNFEKDKVALEAVLVDERHVIQQLKQEIFQNKEDKWNLEIKIKQLEQECQKEAEMKNKLIEEGRVDLAYSREELEISRRTAQDYCKLIHDLEAQKEELQQKYEEKILNCEKDHEVRGDGQQMERRVEGLIKEVFQLNSNIDMLTELNGELQREVNTLKNTVTNMTRELHSAKTTKMGQDNEIVSLQTELFNKNLQITSLEKLITEITVQRDHLRQMADEGTNTSLIMQSDVQKLQRILEQKNKEIQIYQRNEIERNNLMAGIDSRLERLRLEADRSGMVAEDHQAHTLQLHESLQQNGVYCQILESQLTGYRKREILNYHGQMNSLSSPLTAPPGPSHGLGGGRSMSPLSYQFTTSTAPPYSHSHHLQPSLSNKDEFLPDESLTESQLQLQQQQLSQQSQQQSTQGQSLQQSSYSLPLEGKLVSLLSLLEDKLNQLDSVVRQVDYQGSSQFSDNTNESQLEELCRKLESNLFHETNKLNDLKAELTTARDLINIAQAEKEKLLLILKNLSPEKAQRRVVLVAHVDKIQLSLQEQLVEAQHIATAALNCKLECDRLKEELVAAEDALEDVKRHRPMSNTSRPPSRTKTRPLLSSQDGKRSSFHEPSIQEDSNDDSGFMTPTGGDSSRYTENNSLQESSQVTIPREDSKPSLPTRPKAQKQFSELNSENFGFQSPLQLGRKISKPITPKTVGDSEVYELDQTQHEEDEQGGVAEEDEEGEDQNEGLGVGVGQGLGQDRGQGRPQHQNYDHDQGEGEGEEEFEYDHQPIKQKEPRKTSNELLTKKDQKEKDKKKIEEKGRQQEEEQEEEKDDEQLSNDSAPSEKAHQDLTKHNSNQSLGGRKSVMSTHSDNNSNNQPSYFSKKMALTPSDHSLSKIESPIELIRSIETKLRATHLLLTDLQSRKEESRLQIEKWTLFFLRDYGRVPGLAESKYGPSNHLFETFNRLQHEIYSCHSEVQELFDHLDSRRQEIIQNNPSLAIEIDHLDDLFLDPLLSQHEGEEYEDGYKLHFESVENMLLQVNTDSEEMSIHSNYSLSSGVAGGGVGGIGGVFPSGLMNYDDLDDHSKVDVLQNIENDIKEFQQDLDELKHALHESRDVAEELNNKLKLQKKEIQKWYRSFMEIHDGREPTSEDKEREVADLYGACHETHTLLEEELDKMKTFALISSAKSTEIDRLKVIYRKFIRNSSQFILLQLRGGGGGAGGGGGGGGRGTSTSSTTSSHQQLHQQQQHHNHHHHNNYNQQQQQQQAIMSSHNSSSSLQSSLSLFQSLSDRLSSVINEEKKDGKFMTGPGQGGGGGGGGVKNTPSLDSDSIHSSGYPPMSENPQQEIVKLTDDLEMLRSYFTAADGDLKELKDRKNEIKQLMKSWEEEFIQTNLRKPTSHERKTLMEEMYEEYQAIQEEITEILEQREKGLKMKSKIEYLLELRMKQLSSTG